MGFLRALEVSKIVANMPLASGPGTHADEFDASFDTIVPLLSPKAYEALEVTERDSFRKNPDEGFSGERDAVLPMHHLYSVAMLVTGVWGQYKASSFYSPSLELGMPHIPVEQLTRGQSNKNPSPIFGKRGEFQNHDPFFLRMTKLEAALAGTRSVAEAGYKRKGSGNGWLVSIDKMLSAVRFVLSQREAIRAGRLATIFAPNGLPFGLKWGVLASKGNNKLPFVAYSELPMSTCPGAGACGVYGQRPNGAPAGYCYSFKAWRYPSAFARQFLNTLASTADREFSMYALAGPNGVPDRGDEASYNARVDVAVKAMVLPGVRLWQQFVKSCIVSTLLPKMLDGSQARSRSMFVRLFVDGDIHYEDNIIAWMTAVRHLETVRTPQGIMRGPDAADIQQLAHSRGYSNFDADIQFYGYTKCWSQFVNVARNGYQWPSNYTVNLSNNSVYQQDTAPDELLSRSDQTKAMYEYQRRAFEVTKAMQALPISRGYFDVIDLRTHVRELAEADLASIKRPSANILPYDFDEERVAEFLKTARVKNVAEARMVLGLAPEDYFAPNAKDLRKANKARMEIEKERLHELAVRREALRQYIAKVSSRPIIGKAIRNEVAKDKGFESEEAYAAHVANERKKKIEELWPKAKAEAKAIGYTAQKRQWLEGKYPELKIKPPSITFNLSKKMVQDKALSLLIHEALQAVRGSGYGSCPLVCGNCSDRQFGDRLGVHRCASKVPPPQGFRGVHIHIGLH